MRDEESGAVDGAAAGFGRHGLEAAHRPARQLVGAGAQRGGGAVHRPVGQPARQSQPLPQPHDATEGIDHPKARGGRRGNQQAAIVGAEIDRREDRLAAFRAHNHRRRRLRRGIGEVACDDLGHSRVRTGAVAADRAFMIRTCGGRGKRFP